MAEADHAVAVQEVLEQALSKTFNRTMTAIGAGRTDAGVHARGQVTHSILREPSNIPDDKITKAINSNLPDDICVSDGKIVDFKFHATADAIAREYSYSVHTKPSVFLRNYSNHFKFPIDFNKLQEVADIFTGIHDFTTFSKNNADTKSYICNVEFCFWEHISDTQSILHIKADRFVYGMVRCLAGAMLDYARGARTLTELAESLEAKDRSLTSPLATPRGLVLERVSYRENVI